MQTRPKSNAPFVASSNFLIAMLPDASTRTNTVLFVVSGGATICCSPLAPLRNSLPVPLSNLRRSEAMSSSFYPQSSRIYPSEMCLDVGADFCCCKNTEQDYRGPPDLTTIASERSAGECRVTALCQRHRKCFLELITR